MRRRTFLGAISAGAAGVLTGGLPKLLAAASTSKSEETARMTLSAFQLASKAAEIFESGTAVQKRVILETAGSNYQLKSKKVLYELKNPLRIIAEAGSRLEWCDR